MKKAFWIFVIYVELVASVPIWGSQATARSGNQPQKKAWYQQGFQYPVDNTYITYKPQVPQQSGPTFAIGQSRGNQFSRLPVYYPQSGNTLNEYLPYQDYPQPQVSHLTNFNENYEYPSLQAYLPVHYGNLANVQTLQENPERLNQHYSNLQNTLEGAQAGANRNVNQTTEQSTPKPASTNNNQSIPQNSVATATATAGGPPGPKPNATATAGGSSEPNSTNTAVAGPPGSKPSVATATDITEPPGSNLPIANATAIAEPSKSKPLVTDATAIAGPTDSMSPVSNATASAGLYESPTNATTTSGNPQSSQTIPPETSKAIKDASDAIKKTLNNSTAIINALQSVVYAAKNAANVKAGKTQPISPLSSNSDLKSLRKVYKDTQDQIKKAYAAFGALQNKINDLVKRVQDNINSPTALQSSPSSSLSSDSKPAQNAQNQPAENPDAPATKDEDEEATNSDNNEDYDNEPAVEENRETSGPPVESSS